jgi:hypothetical protein
MDKGRRKRPSDAILYRKPHHVKPVIRFTVALALFSLPGFAGAMGVDTLRIA